MALRFDSTDRLSRTANLPPEATFTVCGWARRTASTSFGTLCALNHTTLDQFHMLQWNDTTDDLVVVNFSGGTSAAIQTIGNAVWFFWAMVGNGTNITGYVGQHGNATLSSQSVAYSATSYNQLDVGGNRYNESISGRLAAVKVWDAALSQAELENERWSFYPKRTANLNIWSPMHETVVGDADNDYSGNGRNWTVSGTLTHEEGPPISWGHGRRRTIVQKTAAAPFDPALIPGLMAAPVVIPPPAPIGVLAY